MFKKAILFLVATATSLQTIQPAAMNARDVLQTLREQAGSMDKTPFWIPNDEEESFLFEIATSHNKHAGRRMRRALKEIANRQPSYLYAMVTMVYIFTQLGQGGCNAITLLDVMTTAVRKEILLKPIHTNFGDTSLLNLLILGGIFYNFNETVQSLERLLHGLSNAERVQACILQDPTGSTPLHYAILLSEELPQILSLFLKKFDTSEQKASLLRTANNWGHTPAHWMALVNFPATLKIGFKELTHKQKFHILTMEDTDQATPLHYAAIASNDAMLNTKFLGTMSQDQIKRALKTKDRWGNMAAHYAMLTLEGDTKLNILNSIFATMDPDERIAVMTSKNRWRKSPLDYAQFSHCKALEETGPSPIRGFIQAFIKLLYENHGGFPC